MARTIEWIGRVPERYFFTPQDSGQQQELADYLAAVAALGAVAAAPQFPGLIVVEFTRRR